MARSRAHASRPPLMSHEERVRVIRAPFFITVIPPVKRWGGVQLINDDDWIRQGMSPVSTHPNYLRLSAADARVKDLIDSVEEY